MSGKQFLFFPGDLSVFLSGLRVKMDWITIQPNFNAEFTEADAEGGETDAEFLRITRVVKKALMRNPG